MAAYGSRPNRRQVLTGLSAGAIAAGLDSVTLPRPLKAAEEVATSETAPVLDSPPVLQNPTDSSINLVWAVRGPATGWVEFGSTPELGKRADAPRYGLNPFVDRYLSARIIGLKPGETVHYRICARSVRFNGAYRIQLGEVETSPVFRFALPDPTESHATFAVINDTHENQETLTALTDQLASDPADLLVWNGDVFNNIFTDEQIVEHVLRPAGAAYAAEQPVLFTSGNHDVRGPLARRLSQAFTPWANEEPLGRCFAVRNGPIAMIGLDTGEDKPDRHPVFAGLANFEAYREAQRDWLVRALQRPAIRSAPFIVAFCHIPLWGLPGQNGGDTLEDFGRYLIHAQRLWAPVLEEAKVQLVVAGHTHRHRYDAPEGARTCAQLVGGGPLPDRATLIRASATNQSMEVNAQTLDGTELGRWTFQPR